MSPPKLLLLVGSLRSGSTILGNVLGQLDGFLSVGELADVWGNVWHNEGTCGCGVPATKCEQWRPIFEQALGDPDDVPGYEMYRAGRKGLRTAALPLMAVPWTRGLVLSRMHDYLSKTKALHRAIAEQTQARVVVDHSKYPAYRYVLEELGQFDVYVLHLVRDPRGVVYSWLRRKPHRGGPQGRMYENPSLTSVKWLIWNGAAQLFSLPTRHRYHRIRYEDFVRAPQSTLDEISAFLDEPLFGVPLEGASAAHLDVTHTVAGNPNRFITGRIELRADEEWRRAMPLRYRLLVTTVTAPLLGAYGYGLRRTTGPETSGRSLDARSDGPTGRTDSTVAETVRVEDRLDPIVAEWEQLANATQSPPFLRAGWVRSWLEAFSSSPLRVFGAWRAGELVGLVPLVMLSRSRLASPTNAHTPLFGMLARDADALSSVTEAVLSTRPTRLSLAYLNRDAVSTAQLRDMLQGHGYSLSIKERIRSPFTNITGDWATFERRLTKSRRSELRRRRRRLNEKGELSFEMLDGADDLERLLAEGYRVEASGWKGEYGTAIQSKRETAQFYSGVACWAAARDWLRLAFLRLDGEVIAFQYLLREGGCLYYLKGGFDEDFRKWSPGIILTYEVLKHSFEDEAIDSFEWLGTDDAYKAEWSDGERSRIRIDAFAPTAAGRVQSGCIQVARAVNRWAVAQARTRLPPSLRQHIKRTREQILNRGAK